MKVIETHIVPAIDESIRLQEYGVSIFEGIPTRSSLKKAIKKGLILIDGSTGTTAQWIQKGQKIELLQETATFKIFKLPLKVLYEDEELAVIVKPAGVATSGNYFKTIRSALPFNLQASKATDALPAPEPAHRLDKETSGLLLIAKTRKTLLQLHQDFTKKHIQKTYFAIIHGEFESHQSIRKPIAGKAAETIIEPLETYEVESKTYSLVKLLPITGRTHQLRIHLSEAGKPIVADDIYGQKEGFFSNRSLFLFSGKIEFQHPATGKKMIFEEKLPKKFRFLKRHLRTP